MLNSARTEKLNNPTSLNQGQGQSINSPRKRKRSPATIANPKVQRIGNGSNFDEEIDDLDLLCTAALEQYDLTQSVSSSQIPDPVSRSQIPLSHSISAEEKFNVAGMIQNNFSQPVGGRYNANSHNLSVPLVTAPSEAEKVRILQEQNYTKDGENKVLRGEKERLLEELRKKEEQLKRTQATLLAEKQAQAKQLVKERDSLATKLQFKEQEVVNLREKNALLEQQKSSVGGFHDQSPGARVSPPAPAHSHRSQPQKTSSSKRTSLSRGRAHPSMPNQDSKQTEFLSTETFMPLSQLNLDGGGCGITPVHVGPRQAPGRIRKGSGSHAKATRSRSVSPNPMDMKKMKKRSVSDRGDDATSRPPGSAESAKPRDNPMAASNCVNEVAQELWGCSPLVHAGRRRSELDGAQILLLLVKQNLLLPPFHCHHSDRERPLQDSSTCTASSDVAAHSDVLLSRQSGEREIARGLLSLLHLEPKGGVSSFPPVASHSTPTLDRYADTQRQCSDSDQSCVTTPTRHAHHLLPYKSHTVGRLNLAKSRIRHSSGLLTATRKPHSTANTPIKALPTTDSASSSLLSSINASSLQTHIGNLLVSSEIDRFSSFSRGSMPGWSGGRMPDPDVTEILKQVGHLITSYHREQSAKVAASSTNSHLLSEASASDSMDTSLVLSPRSSSLASKTSSDLVSPLLGDQKLVTHALEILEVLATYSSAAREQILLQPPEFIIDSRPSSSFDVHQNPPSLNVSLEGVNTSGRMEWAESARGEQRDVASSLVDVSLKLTALQKQGLRNREIGLVRIMTVWKIKRIIICDHLFFSGNHSMEEPQIVSF